MTGRRGATDSLNEGFDLLRKYGLYPKSENAQISTLHRKLKDLDLSEYADTPEVVAAWKALYEAKQLIGSKSVIEGKRVLLGDYFTGLAVRLVLPLRNKKLTDVVCEQLGLIGAKVDKQWRRSEYNQSVRLSENLLQTTVENNKLLQALDMGVSGDAASETLHALCRMEEIFGNLYTGADASEMDAEIYNALMGGGKRLRPILLFLCAGFGQPVEKTQMARMMSAIEIIHVASLVHDDIVDKSPLRHGRPTINAEKGDGFACRCGFLMVSAMVELLADTQDDAATSHLADIPMEMGLGELRQIDVEFRPDMQDEQDYYSRIHKKTSKLIEGACMAGGLVSQAGEETIKALSEFGHALGTLFQLRDDMLDYRQWTDEGKPVLQDIDRGIYSLPLIYALEQADETAADGDRLRKLLTQRIRTPKEICYLLETAERSGGIAYMASAIRHEAARAYAALEGLPYGWQRGSLTCILDTLSGDVLDHCSLNLRAEKKVI